MAGLYSIQEEPMCSIEKYLTEYWNKYPQEKEHDPSLDDINIFLECGGKYYLSKHLFILYLTRSSYIEIAMYWCDLVNISRKDFNQEMKNHRNFIGSFFLPVYSQTIKDKFNRKYLGSFESDGKWRWC